MKKIYKNKIHENGSVLVLVIIAMILMGMLATISFRSTLTELFITKNDIIYEKNIYRAEAALHYGLHIFRELPANQRAHSAPGPSWYFDYSSQNGDPSLPNNTVIRGLLKDFAVNAYDGNTTYIVIDIGQKTLKTTFYKIIARSNIGGGESIQEMGVELPTP